MTDNFSAKIDAARKKADQAKARLQALEAQANRAARKAETRRKIILGGLLIEAAASDPRFSAVVRDLMQRITRDHDRRAFAEWSPGQPTISIVPQASDAEQ